MTAPNIQQRQVTEPLTWSRAALLLSAARGEGIRNRRMLALAYDAALRREELYSVRTDDVEPAGRTLRVRAETTKKPA